MLFRSFERTLTHIGAILWQADAVRTAFGAMLTPFDPFRPPFGAFGPYFGPLGPYFVPFGPTLVLLEARRWHFKALGSRLTAF